MHHAIMGVQGSQVALGQRWQASQASPVRLWSSQASTVPSRQEPASTARCTAGTCSTSQRNL